MKTITDKFIRFFQNLAIRYEGQWVLYEGKNRWQINNWAWHLHSLMWYLRWQHTYKYYGEQDWSVSQDDLLKSKGSQSLDDYYNEKYYWLLILLFGKPRA